MTAIAHLIDRQLDDGRYRLSYVREDEEPILLLTRRYHDGGALRMEEEIIAEGEQATKLAEVIAPGTKVRFR